MTDQPTATRGKVFGISPAVDFDPAALLEASQRFWVNWFDQVSSVSKELTQFAQHRVQADLDAYGALSRCKSLEEAMECHTHFVEDTISQYGKEASQLSRLMFETMPGSSPVDSD